MAELRPGYLGWAAEGLETLPSLSERRKVMPQLERRFRRATHNSLADMHGSSGRPDRGGARRITGLCRRGQDPHPS